MIRSRESRRRIAIGAPIAMNPPTTAAARPGPSPVPKIATRLATVTETMTAMLAIP